MRVIVFALVVAVLGFSVIVGTERSTAEKRPQRYWIKIVFGADRKAAVWDGRLAIRAGKIHEMAEWGLEERDQLESDGLAWKITTGVPQARRVTFAEPMRGLLLEVEATAATSIAFETRQGNFEVRPAELQAGRPTQVLQARATVERLGTSAVVADTQTDDDFAAIAVDANGHRHVAWISYDARSKSSQLLVRDFDDPSDQPQPIAVAREFVSVQLELLEHGGLHAVWCSPGMHQDWDVYAAVRQTPSAANRPGRQRRPGWSTRRLTTAEGTDFQLSAVQGGDGTLWLAWQSFRNGNGDIYAKCLRNGKWSADLVVDAGAANQWQPSVSVDKSGRAWVAYDSYENGNYDVYLRAVSAVGPAYKIGPRIAVATSTAFEAHANVLADHQGRVWIAYDAAGDNWGKDFRNGPTITDGKYAEPLHASRRIHLRCVVGDQVLEPTVPLPQHALVDRIHNVERSSTGKPARFYEYPQLAEDGEGRLWLFFRLCRQGYCPHPPKGHHWNIYATTFTNQGWLEPIQMPRSQGRQNQRISVDVGPDGRLHGAWSDGNRFASIDRKYVVRCGSLPPIAEPVAEIPCEPSSPPKAGTPQPAPQIDWTIQRNGKTFRVYFGDLHRHTNISRCAPTIDGCLTDAHRYALDAVELDFLAITDHTRDVDPYAWWRTQQAADLFHVPGRYIPIYAYERSNMAAGGGHRNVFFAERGWDVNPSDHYYVGRNLPAQNADPDATLYPWLKQKGGALTAAHTPEYAKASMKGTWTYNDPQVEPVAEIYQAFRRSYERPGSGVREEVSLLYALRQGHRLGFIASSDHLATHTSYACVWATQKTRKAIFEGLAARRTYAATERIALDVRIGEALMGEETKVAGDSVELTVRALGTAPIIEIEVVRSGKVVTTLQPNTAEVKTRYLDANPLPGESYYYVRLRQEDGAMAWGSPIWVER